MRATCIHIATIFGLVQIMPAINLIMTHMNRKTFVYLNQAGRYIMRVIENMYYTKQQAVNNGC